MERRAPFTLSLFSHTIILAKPEKAPTVRGANVGVPTRKIFLEASGQATARS